MRHRKHGKKLNRTASHRKAMYRNMANSLFEHEKIVTTLAKAKELRPFAEKLITAARSGAMALRDAEKLRDKASDHDRKARELQEGARRYGPESDAGRQAIQERQAVLQERYQLLAEWRRAVAPALHARRLIIARLGNRPIDGDEQHSTVVQKLIDTIGPRYVGRPGGYTRILKLNKPRLGDAGPTALIELVSEELKPKEKKKKPAKRRAKEEQDLDQTAQASTVAEPAEDAETQAKQPLEQGSQAEQQEPKPEAKPKAKSKSKAKQKDKPADEDQDEP